MSVLNPDLARIIVNQEEIQSRVRVIAEQISADYSGVNNLYVVAILKGAFIFAADLTRHLTVPHTIDFMALSSYGKSTALSGEVRLLMDLREPITNRHVLIVEDIVDSGQTLEYLLKTLGGRLPKSLKTCALVRKEKEVITLPVDYLGFEIPDVWVVGYGLDYAEIHRTLPYIAELKKEVYT
jgi:hypoxanthine phosphoribosyltransferase